MMLKTEEDSLNTLRVASREWPGLVYYQGVTSRTTLSTAEKASQTTPEPSNKKVYRNVFESRKGSKSNGAKKCNTSRENSENVVSGDKSENEETDSCDVNDGLEKGKTKRTKNRIFHKTSRHSYQRSSPSPSSRDESLSTNGVRHRRSSYPDKALLPLPNVSWNEMARVDEGPRSNSCLPSSSTWLTNQRLTRPHTAGPRVIVPLKHSCPVGLSKEDIIRGTCLRQNTSQEDIDSNKLHNGRENLVSTMPKQNSEKRFAVKEENHRMPYKPHRNKGTDTKIEALELTITSIQPEPFIHAPTSEDNNSDSDSQEEDNISKSNKNTNNSSSFINSYNFNTMEGIRKSYRRAQSAPPTHYRYDRIQNGNNVSSENLANQKQFSNLYWRAKSSYHKRLEATSEEDTDDISKDDHKTLCQTAGTKHTLLRPLLRVDSEIKHSARCPYKCKGCFKACLVSDDYVQKAIAKAVQESESPIERRKESKPRFASKSDIVKEALGRSQPLFHHVYGKDKVRGRIKIRPWPNYGWMDIKMKREEVKEESKSKDSESDGKSISSNVSEEIK